MGFQVRQEQGCGVVVLSGEVDIAHCQEARRALLDCIGHSEAVLVDLSAVSFLGSSGVANLVEGLQAARRRRVPFGVVGAREQSLAMLELTGVHKLLEMHDSPDQQTAGWLELAAQSVARASTRAADDALAISG